MNAKELHDLWEPLAARAPELRPEGLIWDRHHWESAHTEDGYVPDVYIAALWRDAAVRWLWERGYLRNPPNVSQSPGVDHALAAAVKAVLDAKDAALNSDTWRGTSMAGGYEPDGAKE